MNYSKAVREIDEALKYIESAEHQLGEARPQDSAAIMAAIAQAKLLAVVASALTEMKEAAISQV